MPEQTRPNLEQEIISLPVLRKDYNTSVHQYLGVNQYVQSTKEIISQINQAFSELNTRQEFDEQVELLRQANQNLESILKLADSVETINFDVRNTGTFPIDKIFDRNFIPESITLIQNSNGSLTTPATIRMEYNVSGSTWVQFASRTTSGLLGLGTIISTLTDTSGFKEVPANANLRVRVTQAGLGLTPFNIRAIVKGFYSEV